MKAWVHPLAWLLLAGMAVSAGAAEAQGFFLVDSERLQLILQRRELISPKAESGDSISLKQLRVSGALVRLSRSPNNVLELINPLAPVAAGGFSPTRLIPVANLPWTARASAALPWPWLDERTHEPQLILLRFQGRPR